MDLVAKICRSSGGVLAREGEQGYPRLYASPRLLTPSPLQGALAGRHDEIMGNAGRATGISCWQGEVWGSLPLVLALLVLLALGASTDAQPPRHVDGREQKSTQPEPCFDPADRRDVRLWAGAAPGAVGTDPCRDIPYLQIFPAQGRPAHTAAPAFLIAPGGGYDRLTDADEQAPVAEYFARTLHITAFVLRYRLVQPDGTYRYPVPMWDGQRALRLIRSRAQEFGVDPQRLGIFGFSAGGHLASTLALHPDDDFGLPVHDAIDAVPARPDLLGLGYPVISMDPADVPPSGSSRNLLKGYRGKELGDLQQFLSSEKHVTPRSPPVFLFESLDDARISPQNSVLFAQVLKAAGLAADVHLFPHGVHGDGLAVGVAGEEQWPTMFAQWLASQGFSARPAH